MGRLVAIVMSLALMLLAENQRDAVAAVASRRQSQATSIKGGQVTFLNPADFAKDLGEDAEWCRENIPLFECPDADIQQIYYFRWRVYKKHIKKTPDGFVITEFLPNVFWAGKHNTINCPAGHHFYEGRWLHERKYLDDYAVFWFRKGGNPRLYSFWAADAIYAGFLVTGDDSLAIELLPDLVSNYTAWEAERGIEGGLFWQIDDRDGMEVSIGGSGCRPTINSYMYGDAVAISRIAERAGKPEIADRFRRKAARIKSLVQSRFWDPEAQFFKTLPKENALKKTASNPGGSKKRAGADPHRAHGQLVDVRELIGYVPWYFNLPDPGYEAAWKQLMDPEGFYAPFGPTTAERRHPRFMFKHKHMCLWNGPSWPFATTQTLVALANLLNNYQQECVTKKDYFKLLQIYARCQHLKLSDGTVVPWIDENLHPDTGEWLARSIMYKANSRDKDRGRDYNHSGYCDLVISGLVGLRPRPDEILDVNPLVPDGTWDYFCLDRVLYHGRMITVLYDRTGERYHKGSGLRVFADGKQVAALDRLGPVRVRLPERKE